MATFNGHRNWNHWNVSLWINNDEGLYNLARDCVRSSSTRQEAAALMLESLPKKTPDGARYSKSSIRAALVGM